MPNFRYDSAEAREAANKNLGKLMDNVSVVCFMNSAAKKNSIVVHGFVISCNHCPNKELF